MAQTDISENIYQAIDTLIDARLQNINFNSTVLCTIIDDSTAASGIFTVDNAGVRFQATSMDKSFKVNDQVYVMIPNNNFDAQKIIIAKKEDFAWLQEEWKDPFKYLDIKYKFDDIWSSSLLTPTYHNPSVPSSQLIKRIDLAADFQSDLRSEQFTSENDAIDTLLASGWELFESGSITSDMSLVAILFREASDHDPACFRIKILDLKEDLSAKVPINGGIPEHVFGAPQYYYSDTGHVRKWKDQFSWRFPNLFTQIKFNEQPFYVFYNDKKYQPIPLMGLKNIIITVDIKSNLYIDQVTTGTYLIECKLTLVNKDNISDIKEISLTLASDKDFLGDPYNYFDYFTQTILFDCSEYQNYIVNKIEFIGWQDDNFNGVTSNSRIYIKNPKIYFGLPIQETTKGYKSYKSYFQTSNKYYQPLDLTGVIEIKNDLMKIPPIDTELDSDGPFIQQIGDNYQETQDLEFQSNKNYYKTGAYAHYYLISQEDIKDYQDNQVKMEDLPFKVYEYIELQEGKRFKPKLYVQDSNNKYQLLSEVYPDLNIKYYDELSIYTNYDNKYCWNTSTKEWYLKSNIDIPDGEIYPESLKVYVCYLPGKSISSSLGIVERSNDSNLDNENPPKIGILSEEHNIDVCLGTTARNANVNIITENNDSQIAIQTAGNKTIVLNEDNNIIINNNDQSMISLNADMLLLNNTSKTTGRGIKLQNITNNNSIALRLGYDLIDSSTSAEPAIVAYINDDGSSTGNSGDSRSGRIKISIDNNNSAPGILVTFYNNSNNDQCKIKILNNGTNGGQINISAKNRNGVYKTVTLSGERIEVLNDLIDHGQLIGQTCGWIH